MIRLCHIDECTENMTKGFHLAIDQLEYHVFMVCKNHHVYLYRNHCPHTKGPLDWENDQYLNYDRQYIQCANHGALFEIENGFCIYGPCAGQSLLPVDYRIVDQWICVDAGMLTG